MIAPFKFGVGGPLGNGRQWLSWIALEDTLGIIRLAIQNEAASGPLNAVSPNPVRNVEFARTVGKLCIGRLFFRRRRSFCGWPLERWPMRFSLRASVRSRRSFSPWATRFGVPFLRKLSAQF